MKPTDEQQAIVDAFAAGKSMVIEAGAGTGKTSTLELLGRARSDRSMRYIAYNRSIADDAGKRFPPNVQCTTAHSLAYRAIGHRYRARLNAGRMPPRELARLLGTQPARLRSADDKVLVLDAIRVARVVMSTVERYCRTAAAQIEPWMAAIPDGLDSQQASSLREVVTPLAVQAWEDIVRPDGDLPFKHDHYLKLWSLSRPRLDCDVVLLDEAQDGDPLIADVVMRQRQHAQLVLVGDANQAIYGWRGAVDAMSTFEADARLQLSQSFRFGPAIAAEANKWLAILRSDLRLRGFEKVRSAIAELPSPDAVLCRTNAGCVGQIMRLLGTRNRVALVGGGDQIRRLAEAAITLQAGQGTSHPDLMAFRTWAEVVEYAESDAGGELKTFVTMIERHGAEAVMRTVDSLVPEHRARVIVSTAHKAKGREWSAVRINGDFRKPSDEADEVNRAEAMLAYVAVTRAKQLLDRTGLAWVDEWAGAGRRKAAS